MGDSVAGLELRLAGEVSLRMTISESSERGESVDTQLPVFRRKDEDDRSSPFWSKEVVSELLRALSGGNIGSRLSMSGTQADEEAGQDLPGHSG